MPEARDRRVVPVDVAAVYVRRRDSVLLRSAIFTDSTEPAPIRDGGSRTPIRRGGGGGGGNENTTVGAVTGGRGRGSVRRGSTMRRSVLPSWNPRTPLRDITTILRPTERRRTRLGEDESQQTRNLFSVPASDSQLQHNEVSVKLRTPLGSKVPKLMLDIASPSLESSELTPQKQLLNSIDTVEKFVREEIQKLKGTPRAKKAEREKRVRTLLSMR
ncbi:hypothetical protein TanjilG_02863 [Lupinus angustifolius]|uniref:Protein POLYCHOME n=1 Tax=Lupinus angustifolius TaxID=3871 RepID=A0A4P1RLC4_LUPAN|nr:PREDICTED: protein POLYCHOME-like [Lupinus angustifolius]OIW13343.1 hypothetical protein TanjilG_02863 [Lupinus angustifolius]